MSNFDIDQTVAMIQPERERNGDALKGSDFGKPEKSEYAAEFGVMVLHAAVEVSKEMPVPGVSQVVAIAVSLIKACQESSVTLKRANELRDRIEKLVIILVSELKDKKEIAEGLTTDIRKLECDLRFVEGKLGEIASQSRLLLVMFKSLNEEKVAICLERLKDSLGTFHLSRSIHDGKVLQQLQQRNLDFHRKQMESLHEIKVTLDVVKQGQQQPSQSRSPGEIPPPLKIFHGRDDLVNELVTALTTNNSFRPPRFSLLGLGGMGKTSTALAVINHHAVVSHFSTNRFWVPCVKATSVGLLDETLYSALGVIQHTNLTRHDVISKLQSPTPTLLLLDNFETPWNQSSDQTQIEEILRALDRIPHVAILMTMRSHTPPCDDIVWNVKRLDGVDFDSACGIYKDIYYGLGQAPKELDDRGLSTLFEAVGCMPLAIKLLATTGKKVGWSEERLLQEYRQKGTAMLGPLGKDPQHNMDSCIRLSLDMLPNDYKQSAERLLTMLAVLPTGTTLDSLWVRDFHDLGPCIEALLDTSLIEKRNYIHLVHPLISSYILDKSRLCADAVTVMVDTACQFLKQNQSLPGDKAFGDNTKALQGEEMNLQAILFAATTKDANLVEGLLILARHHRATRPRTEVAEYTVQVAKETQCDKKLLAEALFCYGTNLAGLDRHEESCKALEQARETFLSVADRARAAQCLLEIVESQMFIQVDDFEMKDRLVEEAKSEFESLSDRSGIGRSLYWSGFVHWQAELYSRACELLLEAETMLEDQPLYLAHCSCSLSSVYFGMGDYDQGCTAGEKAIAQYEQIGYGDYDAEARHIIGAEYIAKGKYDDASVILSAALEKFKLWGGPLSIAQVWLEMGRAWIRTGQRKDAQGAIQTSLDVLSTAQPSDSQEYAVLRSQFYLRWLDDPRSIPSDDERKALASFNHISNFYFDDN